MVKERGLVSVGEMIFGPLPLVCPCGEPLQMWQMVVDGQTELCIGHFNCACSPIIHSPHMTNVIVLLQQLMKRYGRYPTADDYLRERHVRAMSNGGPRR